MRLTRRLGGQELAEEALHETWLRLERLDPPATLASPAGYLYRAALNIAANIRRNRNRRLSDTELDVLLAVPDERPGPERIAGSRAEMARLEAALGELTPRQQTIFRETFTTQTSQAALASRFGVTVRTIQSDLQLAITHCTRRMNSRNPFRKGQP